VMIGMTAAMLGSSRFMPRMSGALTVHQAPYEHFKQGSGIN
jgi:hypothetical protein